MDGEKILCFLCLVDIGVLEGPSVAWAGNLVGAVLSEGQPIKNRSSDFKRTQRPRLVQTEARFHEDGCLSLQE